MEASKISGTGDATRRPANPNDRNRVLRGAWFLLAGISLAILLLAIPGYLTLNPLESFRSDLVYDLTSGSAAVLRAASLISFLSVALSLGLAALLFFKRFDQRMGRFLSFYLLAQGTLQAGSLELLQPLWPSAAIINSFVLLPLVFVPATIALIALFPDGRFVPGWSRWLIPVSWVYMPLLWWVRPWESQLGLSRLPWLAIGVAMGVTFGIAIASVYLLIHRYRWVSNAEQRQQTKWVIFGLVLYFVLQGITSMNWIGAYRLPPGATVPTSLYTGTLIYSASTMIFPITLAIAVMRYRLYEIDTVINRTLVYGLLTGALALTYLASVVLLQNLIRGLAGQESPIAVVAATLLVAALFHPFRKRVQGFIDRRFYRRRYDAGQMLARFGSKLGEEFGPEEQMALLMRFVEEAMQPRHVSMWIRSQPLAGDRPNTTRPRPVGSRLRTRLENA